MSESESSFDFDTYPAHYLSMPDPPEFDPHQMPPLPSPTSDRSSSVFSSRVQPSESLRRTFERLDREGLGVIEKATLQRSAMLASTSYDQEVIRAEIDRSQGQINLSRFLEIFDRALLNREATDMWLFSLYDRERKGYIDEGDLRWASAATGVELEEEEIRGMLLSEQGKVGFADFRGIMAEHIQYL